MEVEKLKFIGAVLKENRAKSGMTQEELAAKLGTGKAYISLMENGKKNPSIAALVRFAQAMDADPGMMLNEIVSRQPKKE